MEYFIGIVEDNQVVRQSLEDLLSVLDGYRVAFSEADYRTVLNSDEFIHPDVILLDEHLENASGSSIIGQLSAKFKNTNIIIITGDKDEQLILKAMENGAKGFLYKPFSINGLEKTIKQLDNGGVHLEPEVLTALMNVISQNHKANKFKSDVVGNLTTREKDVLELLLKGLEYKAIAEELNMSYHTVNHHVKSIYLKCDVKSKGELLANYKL